MTAETYETRILATLHTAGRSLTTREVIDRTKGSSVALIPVLKQLAAAGRIGCAATTHGTRICRYFALDVEPQVIRVTA